MAHNVKAKQNIRMSRLIEQIWQYFVIFIYLFLCRHLLINSVRLFSRASSFAVKISYFSALN